MKWFFLLLLLINIGLFVWIYPQNSPPMPEKNRIPGVQSLVLLNEAGQSGVKQRQLAEWVPLTSGPGQDQLVDVETDLQTEATPGKEVVLAKREQEYQTVTQPVPGKRCTRMGPLGKRQQADQISLRLLASGVQAELQTELTDEQEGYWVLIPPQETREAAMEIVKQLREAGVSDLWRFTSGTLAHAISLGLFRNESRAEIRRKAIAAKGFNAEVRPRYRQKAVYWLEFAFSGDAPLTDESWKAIVRSYPGVEQISADCGEFGVR